MEPASLAIGVLPLIVPLTVKILKKRQVYKSASKDLKSILEKIELIGLICGRLEGDFKSSDSYHGGAILTQALEKCYDTVLSVDEALESVNGSKGGRRRSLQYVFSKSQIDQSLADLSDSIFMLNTCLTMSNCLDTKALLSKATQSTPWTINNVYITSSLPEPCSDELTRKTARQRERAGAKAKPLTTSYTSRLLLYQTDTLRTKDESDADVGTFRTCLIGSPLLGTFIKLAMRYGPLSPPGLTLDMPRIIYEERDKALFDSIMRFAPAQGATSQEVARWVARFEIKPSMQLVDQRGTRRNSIIGLLVAWNRPEALKYLLDRGGQGVCDENHLSYGLPWYKGRSKGRQETIMLYTDMRGPLLTLEEYTEVLLPSTQPSALHHTFTQWKGDFNDELEDFVTKTVEIFLIKFQSSHHRFSAKTWALPVCEFLDSGWDIHRGSEFFGNTFLARILHDPSSSSVDILEAASKWLEVLQHTPVDNEGYLYVELMIQLNSLDTDFETPSEWTTDEMGAWDCMDGRTRLDILFDIINPGLRVPLYANPGKTDDLLQLMPLFREGHQWLLSMDGISEPSHQDWKRMRETEESFEVHSLCWSSWPFLNSTDSVLSSVRHFNNLEEGTLKALATHDRFLQLMSSRFERRQEAKWKKLKKNNGFARRSMPGGWELEWWEYQGGW